MSEAKTKKTKASVDKFIRSVPDEQKKDDCRTLVEIMGTVTGDSPAMWGPNIIGFGTYRYAYASGKEGDWPLTAFSPRKQNISIYLSSGYVEMFPGLLEKLGKYKTAKACLYVKRLSDVHLPTLRKLVQKSVKAAIKANA